MQFELCLNKATMCEDDRRFSTRDAFFVSEIDFESLGGMILFLSHAFSDRGYQSNTRSNVLTLCSEIP